MMEWASIIRNAVWLIYGLIIAVVALLDRDKEAVSRWLQFLFGLAFASMAVQLWMRGY